MKDLYKNPTLHYILVPILVGIWPLLVWAMYLPEAKENLKNDVTASRKGQAIALSIVTLDPERADAGDAYDAPGDFSYLAAVDKVADVCGIPASKYKVNTGMMITKDGQKSQSARLRIEEIGVVQLARFLSLIQYKWGTLQCDDITLSKLKAEARPDVWTVEMKFNYYF